MCEGRTDSLQWARDSSFKLQGQQALPSCSIWQRSALGASLTCLTDRAVTYEPMYDLVRSLFSCRPIATDRSVARTRYAKYCTFLLQDAAAWSTLFRK
ncbi:hypothetical protein BGY98DRAFT_1003634 [Russula aff. rugulosa BPL654]|nr:hypothetical protein BGY98DRAFT_1003634 [Russula aff. rugulosa BPL654]